MLFTRSGLVDIKHVDRESCFFVALGDQNRRMDYDAYQFFPLLGRILVLFSTVNETTSSNFNVLKAKSITAFAASVA